MSNLIDRRAREVMGISKDVLGMAEPELGFLKDYCDCAKKLTDAPPHYHLFVALSLVSTVLTNKVWIPFGALKIYPNLWTILLAPSSVYRKSTAISIGSMVLNRVDETLILPNEFTPEALVGSLVKQPQGVFIWSEFAGVLENFDRSYMSGTKAMLTDLYDCPPAYKRKLKDEEHIIQNPCLSILSATAIDWFLDQCKEGDVRSGFLARFIYIPPFEKTHRIGIPPKIDGSLLNNLVKSLHACQQFEGEIVVEHIKDKYDEWLFAHEDQLTKEQYMDVLSGFWSRLGIYALKFSTLYNIAEEQSLIISESSFLKAIELVEILKTHVKRLVADEWIFGQDAKDKAKVLGMIKQNPGVNRRDVMRKTHMLKRRIEPIFETLIEEGSVEEESGLLYMKDET